MAEELNDMVERDDGKEDEKLLPNNFMEDIPIERYKVDLSTSDHIEGGNRPSMDDEISLDTSANENESVSIREEIFMMLNEELDEDFNASEQIEPLQGQEIENDIDSLSNEQSYISNDFSTISYKEDDYYSFLDLDYEENHPSPFTQFLETIYCEKKATQINNKYTEFVRSIDSLTSVLKKISTEWEVMNASQEHTDDCEQNDTDLSALKKHFETELLSEEAGPEEDIGTKSTDYHSLTVKIPVVLSTLSIEVIIFENLELPFPIEHIQTIHWSIHSLKTHIPIPSSTLFVKGTLVASIEYVNPGKENTVHSVKIPVEWNQTSHIRWIVPPNINKSSQKEYIFLSQHNQETTTHYDSHHSFCETIQDSLQDFKFICQQESLKQNGRSILKIQGCLTLCLHLTQEQFVQIDTVKWIQ
ncbi:hypothetical protein FGG79_06135 [Bacillus sp. BHET2]|uniref:hypothetical protein n=1 Tax=Bacillus sp. BHET2 TaxID=2583818 RepID=UPI00110E1F73|nr:hypothetical protein [Bacillus sp. BHET2]TMU87691.1 hypothetical protein FGG79_06135 [Bacillus sp. BHET2]